eukprot:2323-Heterococcus_DN1.PRE.4
MSHSGGHALMTPASHKCFSAPKYFSCVSSSTLANQSAKSQPAPGTARISTTSCSHVASATAVVELQPHLSCKRLANFQTTQLYMSLDERARSTGALLHRRLNTCACNAVYTIVRTTACIPSGENADTVQCVHA